MTIINCPKCGSEISNLTPFCPNCRSIEDLGSKPVESNSFICRECMGTLRPFGPDPHTLLCENLTALAIERHNAGDKRSVSHADLRHGLPNPSPWLTAAEKACREIAKLVGSQCPPNWGFCLMMFQFDGDEFTYISNAQRVDMIKFLREFAGKLEAQK